MVFKNMKFDPWQTVLIVAVITSIASVGSTIVYLNATASQRLVVATTTSLFDTGLLDEIETSFEAKNNIDVYFVSVGTGLAIQFAQRGDADMILVHSPSDEFEFLRGGYGLDRKIIAYNFFEIVGPRADMAEINGLTPPEALAKIASAGRDSQALWVSRGDNSGTHSKEKALWAAAGLDWAEVKEEVGWFVETGSSMGNTLKTANELQAYTLTDVGTYLAYRNGDVNLVPDLTGIVTQGQELLNVYSAIAVNQTLHPQTNFEGAITFIKFLISEDGQRIVGEYGMNNYGQSLFHPAVNILKTDVESEIAEMIMDYAFFDGSECPRRFRYGDSDLYS